jgi:capsule polysaccharide export protein KpsE/RkpR
MQDLQQVTHYQDSHHVFEVQPQAEHSLALLAQLPQIRLLHLQALLALKQGLQLVVDLVGARVLLEKFPK